jgi:RNA ligase
MDFDTLLGGLNAAIADGYAYSNTVDGLTVYCYNKSAVYDAAWTTFTRIARGLVLDTAGRRIVATTFPKFFNYGEGGVTEFPDEFEVYDKLDGSLVSAFWHDGGWRTATKGEFRTPQARAARTMLPFDRMTPGVTYLSELVGPSNKVVVKYPEDECRLLSAYAADGREFTRKELESLDFGGMKLVEVLAKASVSDLLAIASELPLDKEGFVLRFPDGTRLKIKGGEYRRMHALISNLTPLAVWETMLEGDEEAMRRELPEEFWNDFDNIRGILKGKIEAIKTAVAEEAEKWRDMPDGELGQLRSGFQEPARTFIFAHRKGKMDCDQTRRSLYRLIRPGGNELDGYVPSYAMKHTRQELLG